MPLVNIMALLDRKRASWKTNRIENCCTPDWENNIPIIIFRGLEQLGRLPGCRSFSLLIIKWCRINICKTLYASPQVVIFQMKKRDQKKKKLWVHCLHCDRQNKWGRIKWCDRNTSLQCSGLAPLFLAPYYCFLYSTSIPDPLPWFKDFFIFNYLITALKKGGVALAFWSRGAVKIWNKYSDCPHFAHCGFAHVWFWFMLNKSFSPQQLWSAYVSRGFQIPEGAWGSEAGIRLLGHFTSCTEWGCFDPGKQIKFHLNLQQNFVQR